jgi:hypothetical protein
VPGPPRIGYHRLIASGSLAALHAVLTFVYAIPGLARGYPPPPGVNRINIVTYIESLGPVWQIGFGLTASLLIAGMIRHAWLSVAHTVAGSGMAVFSSALWLGFAFSTPKPSVLPCLGFTACVIWHLTIGVTFARLAAVSRTAADRAASVEDLPPQPAPRRPNRRRSGPCPPST